MRYPKFIKKDNTIGFVAPSFGCSFEPYITCFNNALTYFKGLGFKALEGPNCRVAKGIGISNTPQLCAKELQEFYLAKDNDALISCGGGELMCEILPHIDWEAIKKANPKWYMGYSDNTNFTFLLNTICDVASIYGPCAGSFGMDELHESHEQCMNLLTGQNLLVKGFDTWELESLKTEENPTPAYNLTEPKKLKVYTDEKLVDLIDEKNFKMAMEGRLTGGCLDCLANLVGTGFDKVKEFNERYESEGIIWFLEACDLNVMSIRRALFNLDQAGWFKNAKGFIIGRPLAGWKEEAMGLDQYSAVTGVLGKYNVPIVLDADIGHLSPMMPLISGAYAKVEVKESNIFVEHILK